MDKGPLGVHEVKLVIQPGPGLHDGRGVGEAADCSVHLGQVPARHYSGRLVVNANLEPSGAPVHKLDGLLNLDGGDGSVDILGDHVTSVQEATGHVLTLPGIAGHHLVLGVEAGLGDLVHSEPLMVGLGGRNDRGIGGQGIVNTRVGNKVGLELVEIHVESSVKSEAGCDGGDYLGYQPVQVGVGRPLNSQVVVAEIVNGLKTVLNK